MTHSTLTWFSSSIKPKFKEDYIILALSYGNQLIKPFPDLFVYVEPDDAFVSIESKHTFLRESVRYWAYVPLEIGFRREGKQSQIPEEK